MSIKNSLKWFIAFVASYFVLGFICLLFSTGYVKAQDNSAMGYNHAKNNKMWLQLDELLAGTDNFSPPERLEIEVVGGRFSHYGRVVYHISVRDGLSVTRQIEYDEVINHELRIYDNGAASNSADKYIVGIWINTDDFRAISVRARELNSRRWLNVTPTITLPDNRVTFTITELPYFQKDRRLRLVGGSAGLIIEAESNNWLIGRSGSHLNFVNNTTPRMTLTSSGSLGIGTANPGNYKLAVNGTIGAKEIEVQNTNWPDFVFKEDYHLPTLEEVEQHIKEKGHLPNIPSEAEVAKNGISLGVMNAQLLQKIEELTLYLIEQQKQIQALQEHRCKEME